MINNQQNKSGQPLSSQGDNVDVRIGIKKSVWEKEMRYEGYAIVDGVKKELTPALLVDLKEAKKAGKITDYIRYYINDAGNPIDMD